MPKNKVSDPITDQEIAFALLVLSGAMTDRQAADSVGLTPTLPPTPKPNPVSAPTCSSTQPPSSNRPSNKTPWSHCPASARTASKYWRASGNSPTSAPK